MSNSPPKKVLRSDDEIYLIKHKAHQIVGAKLPSNRQILQVFLYNKSIGNDSNESARLVFEEANIFWQKARIPTAAPWFCKEKVKQLFERWNNFKKSSSRRSATQQNNEKQFTDTLDDLFDMAAQNVFEQIEMEEDKEFLIAQRKKGREGCMSGVDDKLFRKEKRRQDRIDAEEKRRQKAEAEKQKYSTVQFDCAEYNDVYESNGDSEESYESKTTQVVRKNLKNIYTPRLVGALDYTETTNRDAIHVISAVLHALELHIDDFVLSYSSLVKYRSQHREEGSKDFLKHVKVYKLL